MPEEQLSLQLKELQLYKVFSNQKRKIQCQAWITMCFMSRFQGFFP